MVVYADGLQSANALRKAAVSYLHKFYAATGDASPQGCHQSGDRLVIPDGLV